VNNSVPHNAGFEVSSFKPNQTDCRRDLKCKPRPARTSGVHGQLSKWSCARRFRCLITCRSILRAGIGSLLAD